MKPLEAKERGAPGRGELAGRQVDYPVSEAPDTIKWQKRLLPFMVIVISILTLFFFTASSIQIYYLHNRIGRSPELNLNPALEVIQTVPPDASVRDKLEIARWRTLATLEGDALQRRYHQANVTLMARIWTGYLGFVTGMILALVGATFILGKMRESEAKLDGGTELWKFSMTTASPGLVLALLGSILMITTMVSHHDIKVNDGQLYTSGWYASSAQTTPGQAEATPSPPFYPPEKADEDIKTDNNSTGPQKETSQKKKK